MGNSICCIANEKGQQQIIQSKLMFENIENINEKEINYNKLNSKNESYIKKATSVFSPKSDEDNDFVNPLPKIVIIKRKKNNN